MRYVIAENSVISEIIDEFAIIRTSHEIMEFNDREEDISEIAKYLKNIKTVQKYELLEYHRFGEVKYSQLGRSYPFNELHKVPEEKMKKLKKIANVIKKLPKAHS